MNKRKYNLPRSSQVQNKEILPLDTVYKVLCLWLTVTTSEAMRSIPVIRLNIFVRSKEVLMSISGTYL